jgi:hypothetical protein
MKQSLTRAWADTLAALASLGRMLGGQPYGAGLMPMQYLKMKREANEHRPASGRRNGQRGTRVKAPDSRRPTTNREMK